MIKSYFHSLISDLTKIYDQREAENIAKLLFEDLLRIDNFESSDIFEQTLLPVYADAKQRLLQSEPIQYITGRADFYGYVFKVGPAVLIPRPETEELVYSCLQHIKSLSKKKEVPIRILDVGSGSGCIPITIKKEAPIVDVVSVDVSKAALEMAKENAAVLDADVSFKEIDFCDESNWEALGQYDIVISNPPYIPVEEKKLMAKNVLEYEPELALFVEDNSPLIFYRLLAKFSVSDLRSGGMLYVETNQYNAPEVKDLFEQFDLMEVEILQDMMGNDRIVKAKKRFPASQ